MLIFGDIDALRAGHSERYVSRQFSSCHNPLGDATFLIKDSDIGLAEHGHKKPPIVAEGHAVRATPTGSSRRIVYVSKVFA